MSTNPRKLTPIRQFSLNSEQPLRRKVLKKQFSEDIPDDKEKWISELGFHVSLCNTTQAKILDRPPPVKQAWIEKREEITTTVDNSEEGIVAKKCKEIRRPVTAKVIKQASLNQESILLSHQQLAERLRLAWKEREKGKQNLNIFLAHNVKEKQDDEFVTELTDTEQNPLLNNENLAFEKTTTKPKIINPLKPEILANNDINYKQIFQKRMRRAHSVEEPLKDLLYCPTRPLETRSRAVVVVPLVEPPKPRETPTLKLQNQGDVTKEELKAKTAPEDGSPDGENKPMDVIIRPMTAASKREGFRSRNNSAFNSSLTKENQRPPLVRASSVPLKSTQPKSKFVAQKRRIKSATKSKNKEKDKFVDEDEEKTDKGRNKKFQRCVSVSGADVVTMVSLISPEESEAEEQTDIEKEKSKSRTNSPIKTRKESEPKQVDHHFTLRKVAKSVSFQQSSIHAVRSFSASFPARRASVAATLMLTNKSAHCNNEKRGTSESVPDEDGEDDDGRGPKRRLVRPKSASQTDDCSSDRKERESEPLFSASKEDEGSSKISLNKLSLEKSISLNSEENKGQNETTKGIRDGQEPTFDIPKEKQCWDVYCKMNRKGVSVSYETILRGMLTPTEYRLRRKSLAICENLEEIVDS